MHVALALITYPALVFIAPQQLKAGAGYTQATRPTLTGATGPEAAASETRSPPVE
jgi:hypothetical protein